MPVLGVGGVVKLIRELPDAVTLSSSALQSSVNSIELSNPEYWSGDEVQISSPAGLPIDTASDGPDCPDGHAMYQGSAWYLGSNRSHIANNDDLFYDTTEGDPFYMRQEECGLTTSETFYIYRDQLDRISFYTSRAAALAGALNDRIPLFNVDYGSLTITPRVYTGSPGGISALWLVQCDLRSWTLNLSAPEVDTTAVGEKYGEAVKSIINGGGTFDFLVDRNASETEHDSTTLMRLLLLTEKGCKAQAQFWMISNSETGVLPGQLYYETSLLVTSSAINVRADDVIAGSADFVTVGEIALKMGTN